MSVAGLHNEINGLTTNDKLQLIEALWNSLSSDELAATPLSVSELKELDRRVARYDRDPASGIPLQDLDAYLETH